MSLKDLSLRVPFEPFVGDAMVVSAALIALCQSINEALVDAGQSPHFYRRDRSLVRVVPGTHGPIIEDLDRVSLAVHAQEVILPVRRTKDGMVDTDLPLLLMDRVLKARDWPFPELRSVYARPIFLPDGSLPSAAGYYPELKAWVDPDMLIEARTAPTPNELADAKQLLFGGLMGDFPLADDASRAHALAFALSPLTMALVDGPTPPFLFTAPKGGTGKTLLAEALTMAATGLPPCKTATTKDEESLVKLIVALLRSSPSVIVIDNAVSLYSPTLAAVLTSQEWTGRTLGTPDAVTYTIANTWAITSNNPRMSDELARRMVIVHQDAGLEQPDLRAGFVHDPLLAWVSRHQEDLILALMTIVRHWIAQGMPHGTAKFGSFESWARVMGGILDAAEIPGFLANREAFRARIDPETDEWRAFVEIWWRDFAGEAVKAAGLRELAASNELLARAMGDGNEKSQATRLGVRIARKLNQIIGGYRIDITKDDRGRPAYCLRNISLQDNHALQPIDDQGCITI